MTLPLTGQLGWKDYSDMEPEAHMQPAKEPDVVLVPPPVSARLELGAHFFNHVPIPQVGTESILVLVETGELRIVQRPVLSLSQPFIYCIQLLIS